jgi:preprotein translocase subunit SecE
VTTFQYILAGIGAVVFLVAWRKGHLLRMAGYVGETKVELRKCNWPSKDELKGSTVLVMMSVAAIGIFTFIVDMIVSSLVKLLMG